MQIIGPGRVGGRTRVLAGCVLLAFSLPGSAAIPAAAVTDTVAAAGAVKAGAVADAVAPDTSVSRAPGRYLPPVPEPLRVVRGFDPPASPYGPGHRGVDLSVAVAQLVRSPAPGTVTFAGPVAGRGVVVLAHADGITTEYEPVRPLVRAGRSVAAGTPIAVLAGTHPGCPVTNCLHWGARRDGVYIDPLGLLAALGPVRLLPWSGVRR